jgi:uncharacterized protein (TIGR00251 family)
VIESTRDGVVITVRAVPRAAAAGIAGVRSGALLVRLASPPEGGAANAELIELIARAVGIAKTQVSIAGGAKSRSKRVRLRGVTADAVESALGHELE